MIIKLIKAISDEWMKNYNLFLIFYYITGIFVCCFCYCYSIIHLLFIYHISRQTIIHSFCLATSSLLCLTMFVIIDVNGNAVVDEELY